jgi:AraC-like DNA-binding protein
MVIKGVQQITTYEGKVVQIPAGKMIFLPKGLYNVSDLFADDQGFESWLFFIEDSVITQFLQQKPLVNNLVEPMNHTYILFDAGELVQVYAQAMMQILPNIKVIPSHLVQVKMTELLYLLDAQHQSFSRFLYQAQQGTNRSIKAFMEANYDKPLKVEDYAYLTGKSISTFRREFKVRFGNTPQKWLTDKRLDKAYQVLRENKVSVTQAAYDIGYENVSHFIKAFKKKYHLTPKQLLLEQQSIRI